MSSRSQRKMQMQHWHITAIAVGIFLAIGGIYFIFGISRQTNNSNAKCTEKTTGVITDVSKNGSRYVSTIEYKIEEFDKTLTVETKKDLGLGNSIDIYYEPMSWSHIYIEGVSSTGKDNVIFGLVAILAGGVFIFMGVLTLKKKKKARKEVLQ